MAASPYDDELDPIDAADPTRTGASWRLVRGTAVVGLLLGAYLLIVSLTQRGVPLGCGAGSGCDEVFRSRWSHVAGIPVGAAALLAYTAALACTFFAGPAQSVGTRRIAWQGLIAVAASVTLAAVWFIGLQLLVLKALCAWCMAEHAVGLVLAGLILWRWKRERTQLRTAVEDGVEPSAVSAAPRGATGLVLGAAAVMTMAVVQIFLNQSGAAVARLPAGENADTGPGPERQVAVLNGDLVLSVRELPHLGNPDAPHVLVLLFDYCCPHCRATHGFLAEGLERYPGQFAVVLLPMPLDADCNPAVIETEPRFAEACDLAALALAVWEVAPESFPAFDAWLFEPERPRSLSDARARAESLAEAAALQAAILDPQVDERIAADVEAYARSGAPTIPVLLSPEMDAIVGRTEAADELLAILESELGLQPSPTEP